MANDSCIRNSVGRQMDIQSIYRHCMGVCIKCVEECSHVVFELRYLLSFFLLL